MQKIVIASSNIGKIAEIKDLCKDLVIKLICQTELNIADAIESAPTFIENALLKARHASRCSGLPAMADDSGLCVAALQGEPGVYSARYAGDGADDAQRIEKLLQTLATVENSDRSAEFHSVMVLLRYAEDPAPIICHGRWRGIILNDPRGHFGFGYDPVFCVPEYGCSAAELQPGLKNAISHRGQAMQQLIVALQKELSNWSLVP